MYTFRQIKVNIYSMEETKTSQYFQKLKGGYLDKKHEINATIKSSHLFCDLFLRGLGIATADPLLTKSQQSQ